MVSSGPNGQQHVGPWRRLFDRIVVVSLVRSTDRRGHAVAHLQQHGLPEFEFFDATSADDPAVAHAIATGDVLQYPPCFRCGKLDCGKPDCNNFLIPAQVATFITYRRLWRDIAAGGAERVLVMEDDVALQPYAAPVVARLEAEVSAGRVPFAAGKRCLLRLGWALGIEHRAENPFRVGQEVRMSNPCHALTRAFAQALVERDRGIVHTADVYLHKLAPRRGEAWTVFPPLAADMSWSVGSVESTIHPRTVRSNWLRTHGSDAQAAESDRMVEAHVKKKFFRPLLVVGPDAELTARAAAACGRLGVDIGSNRLGAAGIASWAFAVEADSHPGAQDPGVRTRRALAWRWLMLVVTDIGHAVAAAEREATGDEPSWAFRCTHVRRLLGIDLDAIAPPLARAVWSVTSWCRIVLAQKPDSVHRIEDGDEDLRAFLAAKGLLPDRDANVSGAAPAGVNGSACEQDATGWPWPSARDWATLDTRTRQEVGWYCEQFGYAMPQECAP